MVSSSKFVNQNLIPSEVRHQFDQVPGAKQKIVEKKGELFFIMELDSKRYPPLASCRLHELEGLKFPHAHTTRNGKIKWKEIRSISSDDVLNDLEAIPARKIVLEKRLHRHPVKVTYHNGKLLRNYIEIYRLPSLDSNRKKAIPRVTDSVYTSQVHSSITNTSFNEASSVKPTPDSLRGSITSSKR